MQVLTFSYLFLKARCKKASAVRPNLMQLINLSSTTWFVAVESFGHLKVHRERTSASQTFCCRWGRLRRRKSHFFKTWQLLLRCFCGHSPPPPLRSPGMPRCSLFSIDLFCNGDRIFWSNSDSVSAKPGTAHQKCEKFLPAVLWRLENCNVQVLGSELDNKEICTDTLL